MSTSIERDLISRLLHDRDITPLTDGGITPNYFASDEHKRAYKHILEHIQKYSEVPSVEAFLTKFDPAYKITEPEDSLQYYVDTLTENYEYFLLEDGIVQMADLFDAGETDEARRMLAVTLNNLNREIAKTRFTDLTETGEKRIERYKKYATSEGALKGISSGFASIDQATGGFQKKQLTTFVGPPKAGKSTIMLLAMMAAHRAFYRPLFIGFEMTNEEQEERHDAIRAGVSHKKLREGTLSRQEMEELEKMTRRLELMPALIFSEDTHAASTLSGVGSLVDKFKPDIVFVDGVYMMQDELGEKQGSPQALTNLTRGFKRMAQNLNVSMAISTQVLEWKMDRKKGVTSNSIGYSSSFAQDSDNVIAVENTDDVAMKKLKIVLGRTAPGMETFLRWDWSTAEFEELDDPEEYGEDEEPKF